MKLKEGDLFKINVSESKIAFGQIVKIPDRDSISIIIFKGLYESDDPIENLLFIINNDILFFVNTFDAKFYHKHWIILGNYNENINKIQLPIYKLGEDSNVRYEDFNMKSITQSKLSAEQKQKATYRKFIAPVGIELALMDYYGFKKWDHDYSTYIYDNLAK